MDSVGWQAVPSLSNLLAFWREGVWLNSTTFAPLCKLLVWQISQLEKPDPEGTPYL